MEKAMLVYITFPSMEEAEKLGKLLLEKRLCACVNIFPEIRSFYWWEGKIENSKEVLLIAKTRVSLFEKLKRFVKENHPYECPCILGFEVDKVYEEFQKWIIAETQNS